MPYLFTSESVSEGHPDKVSDQISDALLDNFIAFDPESKVACETLVTTGQVVLAGEVKSSTYLDVQQIARDTINNKIHDWKYILDEHKIKNILKTTSFDYVQKLEKKKNFPEKAKHEDHEEKTFFKYGPKENKKEILNKELKEKIEDQLKNDMTELGYL